MLYALDNNDNWLNAEWLMCKTVLFRRFLRLYVLVKSSENRQFWAAHFNWGNFQILIRIFKSGTFLNFWLSLTDSVLSPPLNSQWQWRKRDGGWIISHVITAVLGQSSPNCGQCMEIIRSFDVHVYGMETTSWMSLSKSGSRAKFDWVSLGDFREQRSKKKEHK